jgi:hypothetical protein
MSATATVHRPHRIRRRLTHLPIGLWASAAVLVVGAVIGGLVAGLAGVLGVTAGVAVVVFSFTVSSLIIAWADSVNPQLVLPVGLMTYVVKFTLFGAALILVLQIQWAGLQPMAWAMAASTVAWAASHAVWVWRAKIPYVSFDND